MHRYLNYDQHLAPWLSTESQIPKLVISRYLGSALRPALRSILQQVPHSTSWRGDHIDMVTGQASPSPA